MEGPAFVEALEAFQAERLAPLVAAGEADAGAADGKALLQVALANEIAVSELAAAWMPTTPELDVKVAFARQAGDEAGHFQLVADRLAALGFEVAGFRPPAENALFTYLKGLTTTAERIAAGLFTLEALAYGVNERFMAFCQRQGDGETVRIYREYIQPDERAHQQLGRRLLAKHACAPGPQEAARAAVARVLELAATVRASAAARVGATCLPGC